MNTCPNCGGVTGLHSSVLPGCMCQYTGLRERFQNHAVKLKWVGLTDEEVKEICDANNIMLGAYAVDFIQSIEAKLRSKNT